MMLRVLSWGCAVLALALAGWGGYSARDFAASSSPPGRMTTTTAMPPVRACATPTPRSARAWIAAPWGAR
jgi:hypothetical protein